MDQTWENGKKTSFEPNCGPLGPNSGRQFFLKKSGFVSHYISWSEKTNDLILRRLSDEQTDGQTDRRTRVIS